MKEILDGIKSKTEQATKNPGAKFGALYIYVLVVILAIGIYYVNNLENISRFHFHLYSIQFSDSLLKTTHALSSPMRSRGVRRRSRPIDRRSRERQKCRAFPH